MKFNHIIATLSLLAGSAFSHVHASKEVMQTDKDGGKVGVGIGTNIDPQHHVQRRAKAKGKKSSKSNTEKSDDDDEMYTVPLTIRLENLPDDVDMDMMKSALKDLMESTAKDWAKCNTDGNIMLKLVDDDEEEDSNMFERKLGTYESVWDFYLACEQFGRCKYLCNGLMGRCENLNKLVTYLQNHANLWEALIW